MSQFTLPDTALMKYEQTKKEGNSATFVIEPLSPGYGTTIGNALRRVLLSSLEGAAISAIKVDDVTHEFSTIEGIKEDMVDIMLNLKKIRIKLHGDEKATITLDKKGPGTITAADFSKNAVVEIINPDTYIATADKKSHLVIEATVEKGRGYITVERRSDEKMPLGNIALDCIFSPVERVNFNIENTRVGGMTNYDKLTIEITTNGVIDPEDSLKQAARILVEHFGLISGDLIVETPEEETDESTEDKETVIPETVDLTPETDMIEPVKKVRKTKSTKKTE
jgi:DNA-directed RNA polymerase subunit alpha